MLRPAELPTLRPFCLELQKFCYFCIKITAMGENRIAVRIFLDEDDHSFILQNKDESGTSLQEFVDSAVKSAIAQLKKDLFIIQTKEK